MPTDHVACGVPYKRYEDGRIAVLEGGQERFMTVDAARAAKIAKNWEKYGAIITKLANEFKVPVAYVIGFMTIESGGNENACAPCTRMFTDKDGVEHTWCSFAPNCAPSGHKQCCAYGLLQVIHANVVKYSGGKHSGQDLLGNPELAIRYGLMIFLDNWKRSGDVLIAVKWYNGGKACQGGGVFKMGGQVGSNYVDLFVQACNSFVDMKLAPASAPPAAAPSQGLFVLAGMALVGWLMMTRTETGRDAVRAAVFSLRGR